MRARALGLSGASRGAGVGRALLAAGAGPSAGSGEREFARAARREKGLGLAGYLGHGLVTGPRWFGVWAPFALLFSFLC